MKGACARWTEMGALLLAAILAGLAAGGLLLCLGAPLRAHGLSLAVPAGCLHSEAEPAGCWRSEAADGLPPDGATGLRRLTRDGRSTPAAWVPDGRTLLVRRPGQVVGTDRLRRQQLSELWALSVDGEQEWRASDNALYAAVQGDRVAYLRFHPGDPVHPVADQDRWAVAVTSLADGRSSRLGAARWNLPPVWVGGQVVYLQPAGGLAASGDMPDGFRPPQFPGLPAWQEMRARISDDGQLVAATDGRTLWVEGERGRVVVAQADQIWGFAWSPSGRTALGNRLAFVVSHDGPQPELWVWQESSLLQAPVLGGTLLQAPVLGGTLLQAPVLGGRVARGELEHLGTPTWSPDGQQLAFARHCTGSGPNVAGDIWLVNADGTGLRPLALTPADERDPLWSPDGRTLAFTLEGDVWLADLDAPGLDVALAHAAAFERAQATFLAEDDLPVTPLEATIPLTIRVIHDASNTCRDVPVGQIDVYPFEQYVRQVVPHEVPVSWPTETLKAQAVAARTFAWRKVIDRRSDPQNPYDVRDSTADQYMCDQTYPSTDLAVGQTEGQYVAYGGKVIYAFFCAEAGTPTNHQNAFDLTRAPYLRPVDDPVSLGQARRGHGWGMSQWGAQRWADQYGWNYQQILCHYYTSAEVRRAGAITHPLSSLTLPWNGFYLNTSHVSWRANAAGQEALTVTFAARVTDTWAAVYTDTDGSDGWGGVWPVLSYADTATPAIALRVTVRDGVGQVTTSTLSHVGLDRAAPTGTVAISSATVTTLSISLHLSGTDPLPRVGDARSQAVRASLGNADWVWEDGALHGTAGAIVADGAAGDGSAWYLEAGQKGVLFGPYTTILPAGALYRAYFRLKVPTAALTSSLELLKLDVATAGGGTLLGVRYVRGTDFQAGDAYQELAVDFEYPGPGSEVEFRTESYGASALWFDRVRVASHPVDLLPETAWRLPAREGTVTVTVLFVDGAGNVSADVPLTVTVVDTSPPGEWRAFRCQGVSSPLTCTVQVRDAIAGLDVHSAAYRVSHDSGISWSDWLPATCSYAAPAESAIRRWETITATGVSLAPIAEDLIQFWIQDASAAGNGGQSPAYRHALWHLYLPIVLREQNTDFH